MPPVFGVLLPHPPLLIQAIGKEETIRVAQTAQAVTEVARTIHSLAPDTIVIISPHGPSFEDAVVMMGGVKLYGDFRMFDCTQSLVFSNDVELVKVAREIASNEQINLHVMDESLKSKFGLTQELDYGALVPLAFCHEIGFSGSVMHLSVGLLSPIELYRVGMSVQRAAEQLGRKLVVIASGDNSHSLTQDAPNGYHEEGPQFDTFLQESIHIGNWTELIFTDPTRSELVAEDTIPSLTMMLGFFEGVSIKPTLLSYEAPFGVGYTVASFESSTSEKGTASLFTLLESTYLDMVSKRRVNESSPVKLARLTLETYVRTGDEPNIKQLLEEVNMSDEEPKGVFVSIKKHGRLRGCIGSIQPSFSTLAEEIVHNAILSGSADDRFEPVETDELAELTYSVDLLHPPRRIDSSAELDPARYGVIVSKDNKTGLLLPMLMGIDTADQQLSIAKEKAGIRPSDHNVELYRFEVVRYQ